ncbi:pilus (MSHA type) biogenesis protein MshL [Helicobacter turcicus]|uniref:Pilus (MSHA type) biogenesis protein MshL n=1 Tax=Helicobacter turcicus TaxID=2867412 RepID=A0ABS7JQC3_9HELI|nr:pilus (MSHA type) biogenesis protein MshL [Helicobacter turcicus]MBX7491558.1 pilus (MSHA type) biogenesis protein MshL [Helicobacter turcicus]MBX7546409.1 pilus (MSHA type) biogenesis protein MshL [Helicobacter turcicus]
MRFLVIFLCLFGGELFACKERVFNLSVQEYAVSVQEILSEFSNVCHFSVVWNEAEVQSHLGQKLSIVNIRDKDLDFILELLFSAANLHYDFSGDVLHLSLQKTKTFKINYLSTNRQGISNTAVSINNEENQSPTENLQDRVSQSGIVITSEDGFNFWEHINAEILALLGESENNGQVIINKGAGLISVNGDKKSLQKVESYIQALHTRLQKQVLIDVQILSVRHSNTKTMGINWDSLYNLQNLTIPPFSEGASFGGNGVVGNTSGLNLVGGSGKNSVRYGLNIFSAGLSLNRIVEFLKGYGQVQSISNPKVLTLNNQPAMISVGDILRYKKSSIYQNTNAQTTLTNTNNEYPSIFAGVLLDITPLVFEDSIMLKVNPSITKTKDLQTKIAPNAFDTPPNLTTNQLSSIVKVKNNQKVILGGLIAQNHAKENNKIPLLGDIPLIKPLFSYAQDSMTTEEIVFIITPRIIKEEEELSLASLGYTLAGEQ